VDVVLSRRRAWGAAGEDSGARFLVHRPPARRDDTGRGLWTAIAAAFALMTLISLATPVAVLAHGGSGETDGDAALAAGAAVGGGAAAAVARRQGRPKPKMWDVKRRARPRRQRKPAPEPTPTPPPAATPPSQTPQPGRPFGPRGPIDDKPQLPKDWKAPPDPNVQRTRDGLKGLTGQGD
jgi:hypothetical protein